MLSPKLIGISIASDTISILSLTVGIRSLGSPLIWSASLSAGSIDPSSGVLESANSLQDRVRRAPPALGLTAPSSQIALVLPRQLFLTETWSRETPFQASDAVSLRDEAAQRLPGDHTMLQFDCHASPQSSEHPAASAMAVAIRRLHLERFVDALRNCAIHPESVVGSDVARFNLLCLVHPDSFKGRVLCVSSRLSAVECELWKNGVLEWKQEEVVDGFAESCTARRSDLGNPSFKMERGRVGGSLECVGVFGDTSHARTIARDLVGQGDEGVSGRGAISPMKQVFGIDDAPSYGCIDEAAGAIAPYVVGRSMKSHGGARASRC